MALTTLIENNSFALWFHPGKKIVHHKIKKWLSSDEFKEMLNKGTEQLQSSRATKWLSDDRESGVVRSDDEKWTKDDWIPRTLKAGWTHWAIVPPAKAVGQMNMKRFAEQLEKFGLTVKVFTTPEEALQWLESV